MKDKTAPETESRQQRILVVDDEAPVVTMIRTFFETNGYKVATAADGHAALRAVGEFRPDAIILDVMMPLENGYRVSRKIKMLGQIRGLAKVPKILIVTARIDHDSDRETAMSAYSLADGLMYKPFRLTDLLDTVKSMLS